MIILQLKLKKPAAKNVVPASKFDYASAVGGLLYLSITEAGHCAKCWRTLEVHVVPE